MDNLIRLNSLAHVGGGVALLRGATGAGAVMVGDLDRAGRFPSRLTTMGPPKSGVEAKLRAGDVVVSLRGNANYGAVVPAEAIQDRLVFATPDLAVIRLIDGAPVTPDYLVSYINLPSTQIGLAGHRSGSAALRLPLGSLRHLLIPVPSADRQAAIVALNACAFEERLLAKRLVDLRADMIDELLRQAAAEGPASG